MSNASEGRHTYLGDSIASSGALVISVSAATPPAVVPTLERWGPGSVFLAIVLLAWIGFRRLVGCGALQRRDIDPPETDEGAIRAVVASSAPRLE